MDEYSGPNGIDPWHPAAEPDPSDYAPDSFREDERDAFGMVDDLYEEPYHRVTDIGFTQLPEGVNAEALTEVARGMVNVDDPDDANFFDLYARGVRVPLRTPKGGGDARPYFHDGYARMLWDFKNGDLLQGRDARGHDDGQLYRRCADESGLRDRSGFALPSHQWHAIDISDEYSIPRQHWNPMWKKQMLFETSRLRLRVLHGVKFSDRAFIRDPKTRKVVVVMTDRTLVYNDDTDEYERFEGDRDAQLFNYPYELTVEQAFNNDLAYRSGRFLKEVTADDGSWRNLTMFFATPLLEEYKHLTYVLFGDGGNGKGLIMNALKSSFGSLARSVNAQKLLGGQRGGGGFSTDQEAMKLLGTLWAYDDDADEITLPQMTILKKLSTGDALSGRRIQENQVEITPKATFAICTNNSVITSMNNASARRFTMVRMRDGRSADSFQEMIQFIEEHGALPFLMDSCLTWSKNVDVDRSVVIGDVKNLSEAELWIADRLVQEGYVVSRENPYPENAFEHRNTIAKLGLKSTVRRIPDGNGGSRRARVLVVADECRFAPYRNTIEADMGKADGKVGKAPEPAAKEIPDMVYPDQAGFPCDYVPANDKKVAVNWQKKVADPDVDTSRPPKEGEPYGVVPKPGYVVLDVDVSKKEDAPDGWDILNDRDEGMGEYGSKDFPATYMVSTPSGGKHLYYKIPDGIAGCLKNIAHPGTLLYPKDKGGLPVDTRTGGHGYVMGPGSKVAAGEYRLIGLPDPDRDRKAPGKVPQMTPRMVEWLKANNYCEGFRDGVSEAAAKDIEGERSQASRSPRPSAVRFAGELDGDRLLAGVKMAPIGEGGRNDGLFRQFSGLVAHHREYARELREKMFERGRASGLPEHELEGIWRSVERYAGLS